MNDWFDKLRRVVAAAGKPVEERSIETAIASILPVSSVEEVPAALKALERLPSTATAELWTAFDDGAFADWDRHTLAVFFAFGARSRGETDAALEAPVTDALEAFLRTTYAPTALPEAAIEALEALPEDARGPAAAAVFARLTSRPSYGPDYRWALLAAYPTIAVLRAAKPCLVAPSRREDEGARAAFRSIAADHASAVFAAFDCEHPSAAYFVRALHSFGTAEVVPLLTDALDVGDSTTRTAAVRALRTMQEHAEEAVVALLSHGRKHVRLAAAEVLQKWRRTEATDVAVIEALASEKTADVRAVLELLEPPPPGEANAMSYEAARESVDIEVGRAIEMETDRVREGGDDARWRALAGRHPAWFAIRVVDELGGRLVGAEPAVRTWVRAAKLVADEPVAPWASVRIFTKLKSLYSRGTADIPKLREELFQTHLDCFQRRGLAPFIWLFQTRQVPAVEHLVGLVASNYEGAAGELVALLDHDEDDVRDATARALGALGESAVEALSRRLSAKNKRTRAAAARALGLTGASVAVAVLERQFQQERTADVKTEIQSALSSLRLADLPDVSSLPPTESSHQMLDEALASIPSDPALESSDELPGLRWSSGVPMSDSAQRWVVARLEQLSHETADPVVEALRPHLEDANSRALLHAIRERFGDEHREVRIGWVLYAAAVLGSEADFFDLGTGLDAAARSGTAEQAFRHLDVFGRSGTPAGIHWLDHYARRGRTAGLRDRARSWLRQLASENGVAPDELIEETMSDFGLDAAGRRQFVVGDRAIDVRFDPTGEVGVARSDGTVDPRFPAQRVADDETEYLAVRDEYRAMRKTLKRVVVAQNERLEHAMATGRTWSYARFCTTYLGNAVLFEIAQHVLWQAELPDGERVVLRLCQDRTWADVDDEPVDAAIVRLRVAHPLHFGEDRTDWAETFTDYLLVPPFALFDRETFRASGDEREGYAIGRFKGLLPMSLRSELERRRWDRGGNEMGAFVEMWKDYGEVDAVITLDPGLSIMRDADDPPQDAVLQFFGRDPHKGVPIVDVPGVLLSEALRDLESVSVGV